MGDPPPLVIAHRTCAPDAPENSLRGIHRAAELGADAVEVDVRLTLDGRPVLHHDRTLGRTAGLAGPVYLRRARTVVGRPIGDGEHLPAFADALAALPAGLRMVVDLKVPRAVHPVLADVVEQDAGARVMLWSRQPSVVRFVADRHPTIEATLVRDPRTAPGRRALLAAAARSRAAAVAVRSDAVTPELAAAVRARGMRLYARCRTRDLPITTLRLVDGVVTDWPDAARAAVARLTTETPS